MTRGTPYDLPGGYYTDPYERRRRMEVDRAREQQGLQAWEEQQRNRLEMEHRMQRQRQRERGLQDDQEMEDLKHSHHGSRSPPYHRVDTYGTVRRRCRRGCI